MASFRNVPHGKVEQLNSRLAEAGFDESLIDFVNSRPELTREWERRLRRQLNPPLPMFDRLFQTPEQIYAAFMDVTGPGSRGSDWGFTTHDLAQLRRTMPADFTSRLDSVLTLDIWLGNLPTTFEELWSWNQAVHAKTWRYEDLKSGKRELRLLDGKSYGNQLSVKWVVLDLTANRGQAPADVRDPATSPALAVLATAALHPDWPPAINYDTIPGVWLPGLQATLPGGGAWSGVPILSWGQFYRTVDLHANWDGRRYSDYAVPVLGKL